MRNIAQVGSLLVVGWVHLWPLVAPSAKQRSDGLRQTSELPGSAWSSRRLPPGIWVIVVSMGYELGVVICDLDPPIRPVTYSGIRVVAQPLPYPNGIQNRAELGPLSKGSAVP